MIKILYLRDGKLQPTSLKDLVTAARSTDGVLWVDLDDPTEAEEETVLVSLFDFHPLAIEDCQRARREDAPHLPKVEDFGEYLFVIFNPIETHFGDDKLIEHADITSVQLSAFITERVLVTHHYTQIEGTRFAAELCSKNALTLQRGPDFLFHLIIDKIVDDYAPMLEALDDEIDAIELEVFARPSQRTMARILRIKQNIMTIRRVATYQREMLNRLSRGEFDLITQEEMIYYRNVYDHLVRMTDVADSYRDITSGLLDAYLSVTSNNLNQIMKVLTIISTIFLPMSVITGLFGMNFKIIPGADLEYGFWVAITIMMFVAAIMLVTFRKKKLF
ncbi:MAG TPA: magnesium/cobalt transporter CorA [Bacteroidota bacterium]|nr:magnesium/cobalt transporter CorA [Bacteroidota bacterium]